MFPKSLSLNSCWQIKICGTPFIVLLIIGVFFVMNDGDFSSCCNSQVMRCVLCHLTIMNGDAHNLAHRKSLKGLVNYNKDHSTSFLKKNMFQNYIQ
jgi:hypothetical protein